MSKKNKKQRQQESREPSMEPSQAEKSRDEILEEKKMQLEAELTTLQRERESLVQKLEKKIKIQEQALADHKKNTPTKRKDDGSFSKQLNLKAEKLATFDWPAEDLPSNGLELYKNNSTRYLLIQNKEQLEQAQEDATRLNAKLCTREESHA